MIESFLNIIINIILALFRVKRLSNSKKYQTDTCMVSSALDPLPSHIKKIATWNINGIFLYWNNQKQREIIEIVHYLNADLICLQECFDDNFKELIINNLKFQYPYYLSGSLKKRAIVGEDSGLLVLSKLPIKFVKFHAFQYSKGVDGWFSNKGALYFKVDGINFATSHAQSEDRCLCEVDYKGNPSTTKKQIQEIMDNSPFGRDMILLGDLNNTFACDLLNISQNNFQYTFMDDKNIIDYILSLTDSHQINTYVVQLPCNPSDHYPMLGFI